MINARANIEKNKTHYDNTYSQVNVDNLVSTVLNVKDYLSDATRTDTSWHGLYQLGFAHKINGKRVLELGCGDGKNALIMAALGANVVANDISIESESLIRTANMKLLMKNIKPISGDFSLISFPNNSFDYVVGKGFLHHLTHELEHQYLEKVAQILTYEGEARFFEPAVNSIYLDLIRWMIPVPGRPSSLNKKAFTEYRRKDPHPDRDNSSNHYINLGIQFFEHVEIIQIGSIERLSRLLPHGTMNRRFRRWAHRIEPNLPDWFRSFAARSQLIIYRYPKNKANAAP